LKYVVDSCVALKWELPEVDSEIALRVRDLRVAGVFELVAPDILPLEAAHALTRAEQRGVIRSPDGANALHRLVRQISSYSPSLPLLTRAYEISSTVRIGFYDCIYLSLAEQLSCQLITSDAKLRIFPHVVLLGDVP
jgi:predicted nucleic acid-binding protein